MVVGSQAMVCGFPQSIQALTATSGPRVNLPPELVNEIFSYYLAPDRERAL